MATAFHIKCKGCELDRHVVLGQGNDAFYEFSEDVLFFCKNCDDLIVLNVPVQLDEIAFKLEGDFSTPWSETTTGDSPLERRRICEEEMVKCVAGYYDTPDCTRCGSTTVARHNTIPDHCPRCGDELVVRKEATFE